MPRKILKEYINIIRFVAVARVSKSSKGLGTGTRSPRAAEEPTTGSQHRELRSGPSISQDRGEAGRRPTGEKLICNNIWQATKPQITSMIQCQAFSNIIDRIYSTQEGRVGIEPVRIRWGGTARAGDGTRTAIAVGVRGGPAAACCRSRTQARRRAPVG